MGSAERLKKIQIASKQSLVLISKEEVFSYIVLRMNLLHYKWRVYA